MPALSIVINTLNEAKNIERCLKSVQNLGEIIVVDMHSDDTTVEIAKKYTEHIYFHERTGYVEPARNFALSKASAPWILVLDADEEIPIELAQTIQKITAGTHTTNKKNYTHYYLPRKTIIFGERLYHSGWWPDEKIRLFQKGKVSFRNEIHSELNTDGEGYHFPAEDKYALTHYHYNNVSEWIQRMDRYTTIQSNEKIRAGYRSEWRDFIRKPLSEFLRRFFVWEGYKDGVVGLGLCLMQGLSELIVYMKVWEIQKQTQKLPDGRNEEFIKEVGEELDNTENEVGHYLEKLGLQTPLKRWLQKVLP
jgi:glycosyltransferase involved in cell wall biosynthesis